MTRFFKRAFAGLMLAAATGLAFALPAPHDIDAAVAAGRLGEAETLLREVIQAKPGSARAHYELGQVLARQGRNQDARLELQAAQLIDPALKFTRDPQHFRDLLARIPGTDAPARAAAPVARTAPAAAAEPAAASALPVLAIGGVLAVIAVVALLFRAAARRPAPVAGGMAAATPAWGGGYPGNGYAGTGYSAAPARGIGAGGAILGGIAGLAAGYGIARAMEHGNDGGTHLQPDNGGFTPLDNAAADYGNFDAGAGGDSWDDGGSDDANW